jgi:hypothetical protein
MAVTLPTHQPQQTGNATLDRIQSSLRDVIAFLRGMPWRLAVVYAALATDATTTSATYVTLLTTQITTLLERGYLLITMTASGAQITSNAVNRMRVVVNGVALKGTYSVTTANQTWCLALVVRVAVTRGTHTVLLQWNTDAGTMRISGLTLPEEHAHLVVEEMPP